MKNLLALIAFAALTSISTNLATADEPTKKGSPLKVLLVAGGCCHDYPAQAKLLKDGIEERINAVVTVELSESTTTETTFPIYEKHDWANDYDVVIHDECSANVTERPYVDPILAAHKNGVPAVNLHCAMHSYRWGTYREPVETGADNAGWYEMIGIQSTPHRPKAPIDVTFPASAHPIIKGMESWTTIDEELYNNIRVFSGAEALASGDQLQKPNDKVKKKNPDAKPVEAKAVVAWTNEYGSNKTKVFSTTLGHYNDTVSDDRYLDLVVRGLLWTTGNLSAEGTATAAYAK